MFSKHLVPTICQVIFYEFRNIFQNKNLYPLWSLFSGRAVHVDKKESCSLAVVVHTYNQFWCSGGGSKRIRCSRLSLATFRQFETSWYYVRLFQKQNETKPKTHPRNKRKYFFINNFWDLCAWAFCLHHVCALVLAGIRRCDGPRGTRVKDDFELLCGCWKPNLCLCKTQKSNKNS